MTKSSLKRLKARIDALDPKQEAWWPPSLFEQHRKPSERDSCGYWSNHVDRVPVQHGIAQVPSYCPFSSDQWAGMGGAVFEKVTDEVEDDRSCQDCEWWQPEV